MFRADTVRTAATFFIDKVCPLLVEALIYLQTTEKIAQQTLDRNHNTNQRVENLNNYSNHAITFNNLIDLNRLGFNNLNQFTQKTILSLTPKLQQHFDQCVTGVETSNRSICPENPIKIVQIRHGDKIKPSSSIFPRDTDLERIIDKIIEHGKDVKNIVRDTAIEGGKNRIIELRVPCCGRAIEIAIPRSGNIIESFSPH